MGFYMHIFVVKILLDKNLLYIINERNIDKIRSTILMLDQPLIIQVEFQLMKKYKLELVKIKHNFGV